MDADDKREIINVINNLSYVINGVKRKIEVVGVLLAWVILFVRWPDKFADGFRHVADIAIWILSSIPPAFWTLAGVAVMVWVVVTILRYLIKNLTWRKPHAEGIRRYLNVRAGVPPDQPRRAAK
jgi:hypothetical protein